MDITAANAGCVHFDHDLGGRGLGLGEFGHLHYPDLPEQDPLHSS